MSINKYVYIVLYDIPHEEKKSYQRFRKEVQQLGGLMMQESVYMFYVSTKTQIKVLKNKLSILSPQDSHIRGIVLTSEAFEQMDIIAGELEIGELQMCKSEYVIEL